MDRVAGKIALVTGAATGMGRADSRLFVQEGGIVIVADRDEERGAEVAREIGESASFMRLDVSDEQNWIEVISKIRSSHGRLDVLVNNAGLISLGNIVDTELSEWRRINSVNAEGVFLGCKHAIPLMTETGGGSIINMSSVSAMQGMSFIAAYSASKGAVRALTKSVALYCKEQKNGVRCNSVHPDGVRTQMTAKVISGKEQSSDDEIEEATKDFDMCDPSDIANLVIFLASDESIFINGAEIAIDNAATVTPPVGM